MLTTDRQIQHQSLPKAMAAKITSLRLQTTDGCSLDADLAVPTGPIKGAVAFSHPHPQYGGDRHSNVVDAFFRGLPGARYAVLRYDFRGVGSSTGQFANGEGEKLDQLAALEVLKKEVPGVPLISAGYSFGSLVALGVEHEGVVGYIGVAIPLRDGVARPLAANSEKPVLLLSPEDDQFAPHDKIRPEVEGWTNTTLVEVPSADHFLAGMTAWCAERGVAWLDKALGK
jgi:alpha/beta superfamily hydrolase